MIYEEEAINIKLLEESFKEFFEMYIKFHEKNINKYNEIKNNKSLLKHFKQEFEYFKRKTSYCLIYKILKYPEFERFRLDNVFQNYLYNKTCKKIKGIFKHGQCAKTEISCSKIIIDIKREFISIAITKNTLLANNQWTSRCIKQMKDAGLTNLKNEILVISSTYNDLNGNATHCKNLADAWSKICKNNNNYRVIFVCANNTRVIDLCNLLNNYNQPSFNSDMIKKIVIQFDEAHNNLSGIPSYREYIEHMLLYDFVEEFVPITASKNPIECEKNENPLWLKKNIDDNKLNYINDELAKSRIKSNDLNYSSINDAIQIDIDDDYEYTEYDNTIPSDKFKKHYPNKKYESSGYVNACPIVFCGDEKLALNKCKKVLDNQEFEFEITEDEDNTVIRDKIFKKDEFNCHIIITPCRTIITDMLMKYASEQDYRPVTIGLYNGITNYIYYDYNNCKLKLSDGIEKNSFELHSDKSKEWNINLNNWLEKNKLKKRPIIIFGNYQSVGESNTFVNSDYGYLRSAILLPGCNLGSEKHYQFLLRCCFLLEKFTGLTKNSIEKFIISYKEGLKDAIDYENLNDKIVQDLIDNPEQSEFEFEYNTYSTSNIPHELSSKKKIISIPVQFKIEDYCSNHVNNMVEIMKKESRNTEDKRMFINDLISAIKESSIIMNNKNTDISIELSEFTLKEFRCFKEGNNQDSYRFDGYYSKWSLGQRHNNGELNVGECGFYGCLKQHKSNSNHINNPNTFYILFAYTKP